ncbi:MAG: carboxypeptidase-like regulatory domain-containing protein [Bacteroidetes bacterium]|nr:carboxypeptidase-like regulatory domain-containing protein [Bacteroidota bacterium]MCW5894738.1 carboxypeptidase-like regulatory domain-containing protein [Bacteroidota bacterium]
MKYLLAVLLLCSTAASQESFVLTGVVQDAVTGEPLPSANLREPGTARGTVANADGKYRLLLWPGKRIVVASCLGYKPDTLHLMLTENEVRNISLTPSDIVLPEILVRGEDPAIEIIRRAIANKKKWMERLNSFEMDAFTRQVLKRDDEIASITESFTKGYWQKGDTLREIVKQKRQTENIKSEFNFASVGRIINFNDDEIRFIGYTFIGPTADDALDYYDYKLFRTQVSYGKEIYEIKMIPRTRTRPLFDGIINIADDSYALMGVDVQPNESFNIPFVKMKHLRYRQQFGLYDHSFWMPVDIRIEAAAEISIPLIKIPTIDFSQTSVISNYDINILLPDTIFQKPRLSVDTISVAELDTSFWRENNVLPLTLEEENAYATLDSTQSLDVQFRPRGVAFQIGADGKAASLVENLDFAFNRVEGFRLGARIEVDSLSPIVQLRGGVAYGFSDKRGKYTVGGTVFTSLKKTWGVGGDVYRTMQYRPDAGYYGVFFNSITSLLAKNDYRNYYEAEGWRLLITHAPSTTLEMTLFFANEEHRSVPQNSNFSLFARSRAYRTNPAIQSGRFTIIGWDARIGGEPVPFDIVRRNSLGLHIQNMQWEGLLSSNRIWAEGTLVLPTFSRSMLFPQTLSLRLSGGVSERNSFPQQLFDLETSSTGFAPFGVFKAMNVKEFSGTSFVALNLEHNFRSIPFLALGIPFLYENNIELLVHGGTAQSWARPMYIFQRTGGQLDPPRLDITTTSGWYGEVGFSISRIFELIRADFTWRLSAPRNFRFTIGVASLF